MDNMMSKLAARKDEVLMAFSELENEVNKAQATIEEQRNIIVEAQNKQRVLQGEYKVIVELMEELKASEPSVAEDNKQE